MADLVADTFRGSNTLLIGTAPSIKQASFGNWTGIGTSASTLWYERSDGANIDSSSSLGTNGFYSAGSVARGAQLVVYEARFFGPMSLMGLRFLEDGDTATIIAGINPAGVASLSFSHLSIGDDSGTYSTGLDPLDFVNLITLRIEVSTTQTKLYVNGTLRITLALGIAEASTVTRVTAAYPLTAMGDFSGLENIYLGPLIDYVNSKYNVASGALGAPGGGGGGDTTAPVLTGAITASNVLPYSATISWPAATDNVAVVGYEYSLNGGSSWTDTVLVRTADLTLVPGTTYAVRVRARDAVPNYSALLSLSLVAPAIVADPEQPDPTSPDAGYAPRGWGLSVSDPSPALAFNDINYTPGLYTWSALAVSANGQVGFQARLQGSQAVSTNTRLMEFSRADGTWGVTARAVGADVSAPPENVVAATNWNGLKVARGVIQLVSTVYRLTVTTYIRSVDTWAAQHEFAISDLDFNGGGGKLFGMVMSGDGQRLLIAAILAPLASNQIQFRHYVWSGSGWDLQSSSIVAANVFRSALSADPNLTRAAVAVAGGGDRMIVATKNDSGGYDFETVPGVAGQAIVVANAGAAITVFDSDVAIDMLRSLDDGWVEVRRQSLPVAEGNITGVRAATGDEAFVTTSSAAAPGSGPTWAQYERRDGTVPEPTDPVPTPDPDTVEDPDTPGGNTPPPGTPFFSKFWKDFVGTYEAPQPTDQ